MCNEPDEETPPGTMEVLWWFTFFILVVGVLGLLAFRIWVDYLMTAQG